MAPPIVPVHSTPLADGPVVPDKEPVASLLRCGTPAHRLTERQGVRARLKAVVVLALFPGDVAAVVLACFLFRVGALASAVGSEG